MPKHLTFRERPQARGWNVRFRLEQERSNRWLRRHQQRSKNYPSDSPWWWRITNR